MNNNSTQVLAIPLIIDGCVWGVTEFFQQTSWGYAPPQKKILSHSEFQFGSLHAYSNDFFLSLNSSFFFFFWTPFLGIAFRGYFGFLWITVKAKYKGRSWWVVALILLEQWPDSSLPSGHWLPNISQGWRLSAWFASVVPVYPAIGVTSLCPKGHWHGLGLGPWHLMS